ncbi:hypothetical protein MRB53_000804 [Persea americana]|uniref:Uncharacterized protein n=1 Tax=Persea americana TaxID=3435 RepID=A0ACC2MQT6_PERAE|nr:hypothetical protein MRB53_000804 [Persea americana]
MKALQSFVSNPNPNLCRTSSPSYQIYSPTIVRFDRFLRSSQPSVRRRGLALALDLGRRPNLSLSRSFVSHAASHEESHEEIEVEKEKSELEMKAKESQEAWRKTLESFKEQALKMQDLSQEAYEVYSKKAMVVLAESSKQFKIQAEKARHDLTVIAIELSEDGKEYLSSAADNAPESVKDIVETFSTSTEELKEVSEVRDFYLGIPYGLFLSVGGFLSFMLTGSIPAIRFGVVLGGALLALSIASLRSWRRGEASASLIKGQAAIAAIIFLRELLLRSQKPSICTSFTTLTSGLMVKTSSWVEVE